MLSNSRFSLSHLCHFSLFLSDHLSLSALACVCGSLGSVSPVASTQPPVSPVTRSLGNSLCSGAGGQVIIIRGSDTLINSSSQCRFFCSLQHGLRCGVHMELAKVCADQDQLQMALEHVNKVYTATGDLQLEKDSYLYNCDGVVNLCCSRMTV